MNFYITDDSICIQGDAWRNLSRYKLYKYPDVRSLNHAVRITLPNDFPVRQCKDGSWSCIGRVNWPLLKPTVMFRVDGRLRPCRMNEGMPDALWGYDISHWGQILREAGHRYVPGTGYVINAKAVFQAYRERREAALEGAIKMLLKLFCPEGAKTSKSARREIVDMLDGFLDNELGLPTCIPFTDEHGTPCWDLNPCRCRTPKGLCKGPCPHRCGLLPPVESKR